VIAYLRVKEGVLPSRSKVRFMASAIDSEAEEAGVFAPEATPVPRLEAGEVGYLVTGLKDVHQVKVGDTVEVYVERIENALGEAVISRDKARREESWVKLEKAFENNERVNGVIFNQVKGGFTVDLDGAVAFLPRSQVDIRPIRDVGPLMNVPQPFQILKMDRRRGNIVVSRRTVLEESRAEQRSELVPGVLDQPPLVDTERASTARARLAAAESSTWSRVFRTTCSVSDTGAFMVAATPRARSSAWLKPRRPSRERCSGTGTTASKRSPRSRTPSMSGTASLSTTLV
jgi:hypothetical protein